MDVTLHIGLPKTGSSAIQNWGVQNADALATLGICFLPSVMEGHRIAAEFVADPVRANDEDVLAIKNALDLSHVERTLAEVSDKAIAQSVVISSEYFYISNQFDVATYFNRLGLNVVKIIAFVRRQDHLLASGYNQDVKALKRFSTFEVLGYEEAYDYFLLAQTWQRSFPKAEIQLHNFDRLARLDSVVSTFARDIGAAELNAEDHSKSLHVNDSLCAEMVEIVRVANSLGLYDIARLAAETPGTIPGHKFSFNSKTATTILKIYKAGNQRLADIYGEEFQELCEPVSEADGVDFTGNFPVEYALRLLDLAIRR